jgi:hypothetical protein
MQILLLLPKHARCVADVKCFLTQQQIESGTNKVVQTGAKGVAKTLLLPLRDVLQVIVLVPTQRQQCWLAVTTSRSSLVA